MDLFSNMVGLIPLLRLQAIIDAEDVLNDLNFDGHHNMINNVLGGSPENTDLELGEAIEYCYHVVMHNSISVFGIRLSELDHSLKDLVIIARALVAITDPMNHDVVEENLEAGYTNEEILSSILAELEEPDTFWFMEKIEFVDADLIERIKGELNNIDHAEDLGIRHSQVVQNYREYMGKSNPHLGVVYDNVDNVEFLPMTFRTMFVALQDQLRELGSEILVEELYQLMILSDETMDSFVDNVNKIAVGLWPEYLEKQLELIKYAKERVNVT